ncbi:MAG: FKBP-type peptidyl-prolyl cis-trans isomerase [Deltaproteobacteria bacterium]|nr:FKBP-type peptidyl-prolyl cis-trans isomerase [Deltaproteobacteria bacterium]MBN2671936.1 FKBP-type peptidyl-prolyl cis-trans isomerase [Deltaproteobacteria bacterium]
MYKRTAAFAIALILVACNKPCPETAKEESKKEVTKADLKDINDKLNYSVGYDVGRSAQRNKLELKEDIFLKGLIDGMADTGDPDAGLLTDKERIEIKREHSKAMRETERKEREEKAKENKTKADAFLAENKKKEGIVTTESGLQYKILSEGDGPKPTLEDRVSVHYTGTLVDGTEFDSSKKRNRPATFPVGRVVKGWTEALQLMPVGSKWQLFIPPDLGYGERGAGSKIEPNSALIFEIELLDIVKEDENAPGASAPAKPAMKPAMKPAAAAKPAAAPAAAKPAASEE